MHIKKDFLRAESFYNVATQEEEYADFEHPSAKYHEKSHGESFLALAQSYLHPNGLYLFDEPEADIYCFDNGRIHPCEYEDTESYQVTEMFINNRQMLLYRLLTE